MSQPDTKTDSLLDDLLQDGDLRMLFLVNMACLKG